MQFKQVKCRGVTYKNMSPSGEADTFKLYPVEGTRSRIWGPGPLLDQSPREVGLYSGTPGNKKA